MTHTFLTRPLWKTRIPRVCSDSRSDNTWRGNAAVNVLPVGGLVKLSSDSLENCSCIGSPRMYDGSNPSYFCGDGGWRGA